MEPSKDVHVLIEHRNNKYHGKGEFYFESTGETAMIEHNEGVEIKKKS